MHSQSTLPQPCDLLGETGFEPCASTVGVGSGECGVWADLMMFVPAAFAMLSWGVKVRNIGYAVNQWRITHPWVIELSFGPSILNRGPHLLFVTVSCLNWGFRVKPCFFQKNWSISFKTACSFYHLG